MSGGRRAPARAPGGPAERPAAGSAARERPPARGFPRPPPAGRSARSQPPVRGYPPMKAVILAGGIGSRLSEETQLRPKPMIEIGGKPILWHIMKIYAAHGIEDFVVCLDRKSV